MTPRRSIGPIDNSSLPAFGLATALRTAFEGKLPVKIRRNVSSIVASDDSSGGASRVSFTAAVSSNWTR